MILEVIHKGAEKGGPVPQGCCWWMVGWVGV